MADVISDRSSTNGGLKEDIDEIKLNGDKCDSLVEPEEEADNDASSEACISKKVMSDVNAVDKLHELKEKSSITIANGHIRSSDSPDTKTKSPSLNDEGSESNESPVAENDAPSATEPEPSTDEQNDEDISGELENDDEEVENDEEEVEEDEEEDEDVVDSNDCDSGPLNFAQKNKRSDESDDVLNLKASSESADGSSQKKDELRRTTDDKTESSSTAAASSEDGPQAADEDHAANSSSSPSDLSKSVDDQETDPLSSDSSSAQKKKRNRVPPALDITPRRSSRNLNKQKNYSEKELLDFENNAVSITQTSSTPKSKTNEDDEIEEVTPTDPLADDPKLRMRANKPIVVSDTKGLVEFATSAKMPRSNKKEPTLVIIDTNSILSGRGPVPISQSNSSTSIHSVSGSAPIPVSLPIPAGSLATRGLPASTSAFSVIPIGIPPQGMYPQYKNPPPQMKPIVVGPASTSVTPITIQSVSSLSGNTSQLSSSVTITGVGPATQQSTPNSSTKQQPQVILPSLTDDMFVVEAPSFIVPYVYEKPPMKSLKDYIDRIANEVREAEEKEKQEREEKERLEREEKEKQEKEEREKAERERAEAEEKKKEEEKAAVAEEGAGDAPSKDESMEVDDESGAKSAEKTASESDASSEKKDETSEKDTVLQMEVDEEADPDASKVTSENDVVLSSSKKVAESTPAKKDEAATTAAAASTTPAAASTTPAAATPKDEKKVEDAAKKQPLSYFENPLGKFFMQIGLNLVQEHVQTDLLRSQKRRRDKEGDKCSADVKLAIETLSKTLESSKENNDPFKLELRKCELCSFKTESILVMAHHLETPHMKNYTYRCNFCPFEVRSPHDILFHMESEHNIRGRLERAPAFHQCPNCPFEDNQKGKLTRHMVSCAKKYRPERNQEPPLDWEPPAKIPRVTRNRPPSMSPGNAVYQAAMSGLKQVPQNTLLPKLMPNAAAANLKQPPNLINVNKRPNAVPPNFVHRFPNAANQQGNFQQRPISVQGANQGLMYRNPGTNSQTQVILPQNYQLSGAQIYQQNQNAKHQAQMQQGLAAAKLLNQPSISITPLPRQAPSSQPSTSNPANMNMKPGKPPGPGNKNSFVVCEICDSGIKDLEQLRNHMQWIHKVKIHPKMIYNRPPLNCQKCQFRFFTDQGLERHLLGSHGLVTSSMQEAANKGKDSGRCPVCGRVYQWKLLNHVARDHSMALKPAHLSYKCTVCTATFGMYKQFESHVYSAHSVVAKRAMDPKKPPVIPSSSSQNDALLKPLKINDEITIIPQPVRAPKPPNKPPPPNSSANSGSKGKDNQLPCSDAVDQCDRRPQDVVVIDCDDNDAGRVDDFKICTKPCAVADFASEDEYRRHLQRHVRPLAIRVPKLDLSRFIRVPDRLNSFRLPKRKAGPAFSRGNTQFEMGAFRLELTNLCLSQDCVYQVVQHVVDPALLEPHVLLYLVEAGGRLCLVKGFERMAVSSVNTVGLTNPSYGHTNPSYSHNNPSFGHFAAAPYATSATSAQHSHRQPQQQPSMNKLEELSAAWGVPLDYLIEVTRSFGSSHFMLNSPLSCFPLLQMAPKPRSRPAGTPRQNAPVKKPPSDVVVLRNSDGSMAISGEINLSQTARIVTGPLAPVTTVAAGHVANGTIAPNAVSRLQLTSVTSSPSTISRSLTYDNVATTGGRSTFTSTTSMTRMSSGSMTHVHVINGSSMVIGPPVPQKMVNQNGTSKDDQLLAKLLASKQPTAKEPAQKPIRANKNGVGNPLVMKRVPLSVRQPPYPKVVPAERAAAKSQSGPPDPVFVSVGQSPPASPSDDVALGDEVIDLLSDDEQVENPIDENEIGPSKVVESVVGPKKVVDDGVLDKADGQSDPPQEVDDTLSPDEVEEIIVLE